MQIAHESVPTTRPQETLSIFRNFRWAAACSMAWDSCLAHGSGMVSGVSKAWPRAHDGRVLAHCFRDTEPTHAALACPVRCTAGDTPFPYITGIALVMLQPFVDLSFEIGQTPAPPVGLPTLASTYYSECTLSAFPQLCRTRGGGNRGRAATAIAAAAPRLPCALPRRVTHGRIVGCA